MLSPATVLGSEGFLHLLVANFARMHGGSESGHGHDSVKLSSYKEFSGSVDTFLWYLP